jgi:hypothetical protein
MLALILKLNKIITITITEPDNIMRKHHLNAGVE